MQYEIEPNIDIPTSKKAYELLIYDIHLQAEHLAKQGSFDAVKAERQARVNVNYLLDRYPLGEPRNELPIGEVALGNLVKVAS